MARRTKEDAEKTYHALLDAAIQLFSQQGLAKTTLNDIASAAGMTRGAVYWHFENKDAVIKALWERSASHLQQQTIQSLQQLSAVNPLEDFVSILKSMLQDAFSDPSLNQALRIIFSSMEFTNSDTELQTFLLNKRNMVYSALNMAVIALKSQDLFKEELDVALITNGTWAFIIGILRTHLEPENASIGIANQCDVLIDQWIGAITRDKP
ncbi:TetR family transcriptional regulator [Teredinibacter franksiae]|uniref:TetR family transcriptional regulator n=1 Tax=Teredinibacter franksiae TaxID=2761453 RepID=UPI0016269EE5|nr:TetR family transcriptional regulator [Teredinibacter franksiae]